MPEPAQNKDRDHPWKLARRGAANELLSSETREGDAAGAGEVAGAAGAAATGDAEAVERSGAHAGRSARRAVASPTFPFAELCLRTNFTFLTGASHPDEYVQHAARLGHSAGAVADTNSFGGAVRAHVEAERIGLSLAVGCHIEAAHDGRWFDRLTTAPHAVGRDPAWAAAAADDRESRPIDHDSVETGRLSGGVPTSSPRLRFADAHDESPFDDADEEPCGLERLFVYPCSKVGYQRLSSMLTEGKRRAPKGECWLTLHDVIAFARETRERLGRGEAWGEARSDASAPQPPLAVLMPPGNLAAAPASERFLEAAAALRDAFGARRLALAAVRRFGPDDLEHLDLLHGLAGHLGLPLVASCDALYHHPSRKPLQDVLRCIGAGVTLDGAGYLLAPNAERCLKPASEMRRLFADFSWGDAAVRRAGEWARRAAAGFSMSELKYDYPHEVCPPGVAPDAHLRDLVEAGARERYPDGVPGKVRQQIEHELSLIAELRYEHYFLTVHDIVRFARSRGILCQGRGAAANSAVCYCLGVTAVDPARIDLLFERFISKERDEPPDIDIDFEHERREEVLQYVYDKYGRDRAALTSEIITYRSRSAVREVGKALGLSLDCVDRIAKNIDRWESGESWRLTPEDKAKLSEPGNPTIAERFREVGLNPGDPTVRRLMKLVGELRGFPRHRSQHVGGFVISDTPLRELVPIENASMADRTVIEWDKDDIEALGLLKVDCLGLGMLTCISKALAMVNGLREATERHGGVEARRHAPPDGRDEETKRRRDEVGETGCDVLSEPAPNDAAPNPPGNRMMVPQEVLDDGQREDVPGLGRVATVYDARPSGVRRDANDADQRAFRLDRSDAKGCDIRALEHRRRLRTGEPTRIAPIFANRSRLAERTLDPGGDRRIARDAERCAKSDRDHHGDRSDLARAHPQPRSEDDESLIDEAEVTSSLRLSVSPSLPSLQLHTIPPELPAVYDMISAADTLGVFQIESRAQMSMLPRLKPRTFYDLVIEVAIVRPGPIQGDMVHPYLRRRDGLEPVEYPSETVRRILGKTLGVPLFQEQAMSLAIHCAGFTPGEADRLRRAIAAWKTRNNLIELFGRKIVDGMTANGYSEEFAQRCFSQLKGFAEYGFPESHAASFALLVYVSCYLKRFHPAAFCAALLNSQPMGFYAPAQIVRDAKEHGVTVRPVDVNESDWDCSLEDGEQEREAIGEGGASDGATERRSDEGTDRPAKGRDEERVVRVDDREADGDGDVDAHGSEEMGGAGGSEEPRTWGLGGPAVRLGMRVIKGMRDADARCIVEERRRGGAFGSLDNLLRRTGVKVSVVRQLARADAFASLGLTRQAALWQAGELRDEHLPLFDVVSRCEGAKARRDEERESRDEGEAIDAVPLRASVLSRPHPPPDPPPDLPLPSIPRPRQILEDYGRIGLSLKGHPLDVLRGELARSGVRRAADLADERACPTGGWVEVAGVVLVRQRPGTASGVVFMTIEDETGIANLIIRPKIFETYRQPARHAGVVLARGKVEREGRVVHVQTFSLRDLTHAALSPATKSRDFH